MQIGCPLSILPFAVSHYHFFPLLACAEPRNDETIHCYLSPCARPCYIPAFSWLKHHEPVSQHGRLLHYLLFQSNIRDRYQLHLYRCGNDFQSSVHDCLNDCHLLPLPIRFRRKRLHLSFFIIYKLKT